MAAMRPSVVTRVDVAVADGGEGDDAPPERVERRLDRLVDAVLGDVHPGRTEDHDAEPGEQQPGEALVSSQAVEVQPGPIDAGEGSNESKQPKEPKRPGRLGSGAPGRRRRSSGRAGRPSGFGRPGFDCRIRGRRGRSEPSSAAPISGRARRLHVVDDEAERHVHDRERRHRQLPRHLVRDEPAVEGSRGRRGRATCAPLLS